MGRLRQEPVAAQTLLTAILNLVVPALGVLIAFNTLPWSKGEAGAVNALIGATIAVFTAIVGFAFVRNLVTPLANPQANGRPLIEASLTADQVTALNRNPDHAAKVRDALTSANTQALQENTHGWQPVM